MTRERDLLTPASLAVQRRQMEQQLADAQGRVAAAELEAVQQSERITVLTFAEKQAKEMSTELVTLKEHQAEIVAQLEAVRKEKTTLQVPQQSHSNSRRGLQKSPFNTLQVPQARPPVSERGRLESTY